MAYGRKNKSRKSTSTRASAARKVQRFYRKRRTAPAKAALISNAKAISALQSKVMGPLKKNYHVATFSPTTVYQFGPQYPYAFPLNDFTEQLSSNLRGGTIYGPTYTAVGPAPGNIQIGAQAVGHFIDRNPVEALNIQNQFRMWDRSNVALANNQAYYPIYAEYTFTFTRDVQDDTQSDIYVRLDRLKTRRQFVPGGDSNISMPTCLGAFQNMANRNNPKIANCYNPAYFGVKTRWLKLRGYASDKKITQVSTKFRMAFPKKLVRMNASQISATEFETFAAVVDPKIPEWMVVSVSNAASEPSDSTPLELNITRKIVWRDATPRYAP